MTEHFFHLKIWFFLYNFVCTQRWKRIAPIHNWYAWISIFYLHSSTFSLYFHQKAFIHQPIINLYIKISRILHGFIHADTHIKSNRLRWGIGDRRGLAEWHLILSDRKCWWWLAKKLSSSNLGGHGQKF